MNLSEFIFLLTRNYYSYWPSRYAFFTLHSKKWFKYYTAQCNVIIDCTGHFYSGPVSVQKMFLSKDFSYRPATMARRLLKYYKVIWIRKSGKYAFFFEVSSAIQRIWNFMLLHSFCLCQWIIRLILYFKIILQWCIYQLLHQCIIQKNYNCRILISLHTIKLWQAFFSDATNLQKLLDWLSRSHILLLK